MRVAIVGAGLGGPLLAALLGGRGHTVTVYDRRPDPRAGGAGEGRSVNLGVSARGIRALRRIGLWDDLAPHLVPMRGRAVHTPGARHAFTPYGTDESQVLHSVRRSVLNAALITRAEKDASFVFGTACVGLDPDTGTLTLADGTSRSFDLVVGADGAFSTVRDLMQRGRPADFRRDYLPWGYREVTIPSAAPIPHEALNLWPGRHGLVLSHPNVDGSHTGTVFLPLRQLAELTTEDSVARFFAERFPAVLDLAPGLPREFAARPVGHLVTVRTSLWSQGRAVLVGDAAHAVTPFYGQGMNAALEDCLVLDECLAAHPVEEALAAYQAARKPHTDVLADLSERNFAELRDGVRSPLRRARAHTDRALARLLPGRWLPLYTMISHTALPYADALRRARRQDLALTAAAAGLAACAALALRHPETDQR
ncbi:NAD(P)/FAD-dependent oxidoreductase [Actinocorallia sp. A-T 12471]|uniref:FAD-dependent oxidoreductase n=1 Tax=Actinocorallia sp. A-T 12471 TaxID=3089813 RepID=UPI0029D401A2|nr:NAD(P)/FAD-dependent oxidoreductase [Actinocorallia sp. A-T 12471]MDX6739388.1 NAD(P)/FAD-dependent oxidoreductase [Actinocorallia sp. A-T 12471]